MSPSTYIVTTDLDLPPLKSGIVPDCVFSQFASPTTIYEEFTIPFHRIRNILKWARECDLMVFDSVSGKFHPDLISCIFMRLFHKKPIVIMTGDMWNKGNFLKYNLQKLIVRLADPVIDRYVVHSTGEEKIFAKLWGVPNKKVRSCIYNYTFTDAEINGGEIKQAGYIFAGGRPGRDYDSLLETARLLPQRKFIIATKVLEGRKDIPPNVNVVQVSHVEFIKLMREADMVITPLVSGQTKSSGQQTYLNAMRMGKISIVNGHSVMGVTDYIESYMNGILSDGTPESYSQIIEWVYNPANEEKVKKIQMLAKESVQKFSYVNYINVMGNIIQEAVDEKET